LDFSRKEICGRKTDLYSHPQSPFRLSDVIAEAQLKLGDC